MLLAQVNREYDKFQQGKQSQSIADRIPRQHMIKDSGAIEQDADAIIMLHREDWGPQMFMRVDKCRYMPTGEYLTFNCNIGCSRFEDEYKQV